MCEWLKCNVVEAICSEFVYEIVEKQSERDVQYKTVVCPPDDSLLGGYIPTWVSCKQRSVLRSPNSVFQVGKSLPFYIVHRCCQCHHYTNSIGHHPLTSPRHLHPLHISPFRTFPPKDISPQLAISPWPTQFPITVNDMIKNMLE